MWVLIALSPIIVLWWISLLFQFVIFKSWDGGITKLVVCNSLAWAIGSAIGYANGMHFAGIPAPGWYGPLQGTLFVVDLIIYHRKRSSLSKISN